MSRNGKGGDKRRQRGYNHRTLFESPFVQISDLKGTFTEKFNYPVVLHVKAGRIEVGKYDTKIGGIELG